MSAMTNLALQESDWSRAPKLRLVPKKDDAPLPLGDGGSFDAAGFGTEFAFDADAGSTSVVLVAGRDPASRASVIESLSEIMSPNTIFQEVGTFWEVLVRAPAIRMIVLSDELDGIPTESLLHMLGHRHPGLPVVSLGAGAPRDEALAAQ
jgi:hypothetical protein